MEIFYVWMKGVEKTFCVILMRKSLIKFAKRQTLSQINCQQF